MIRYAVIGIGRMGSIHARNLHEGKDELGRLVAVCDVDDEKLKEFKLSAPEIRTYGNYKDILVDDVDAVIVATPHYSHGEIVRYFLSKGVSVLSEKPQCVSVSEALFINETAKNCNANYGIMYNQRTNPVYARAKSIIENQGIGRLRRVEMVVTHWYRSQFYYDMGEWRASWKGEGGGLLINQCVHQIDVLLWLVGMPKNINAKCKTVNRNITVENDVVATMEFDGGATGVFIASGHELYGTNRLEIVGDAGKIIIDDYNLTYIKYLHNEIEVNDSVVEGYGETDAKIEKLSYCGEYRDRDERLGQQLRVIEAFSKHCLGNGEMVADGSEGIRALSLINAIYLSHYSNSTIVLPFAPKEYDDLLKKLVEGEEK